MFHIKLTPDSAEESLSLCLPDHIARNIVQNLNRFSPHVVEAHGLGMVCVIPGPISTQGAVPADYISRR